MGVADTILECKCEVSLGRVPTLIKARGPQLLFIQASDVVWSKKIAVDSYSVRAMLAFYGSSSRWGDLL
jgi:hypothetical protein